MCWKCLVLILCSRADVVKAPKVCFETSLWMGGVGEVGSIGGYIRVMIAGRSADVTEDFDDTPELGEMGIG